MYEKKFIRALVEIVDGNPCTPMDGDFFRWTSKTIMFQFWKYKFDLKNIKGQELKGPNMMIAKDKGCRQKTKYCKRYNTKEDWRWRVRKRR